MFGRDLVLDNGKPFHVETFQRLFLEDVDAGVAECWFVVPEGQGKTTLLAAYVLRHLELTPGASVVVAASTRDQAMLLYRQAKGFVVRSGLADRFECMDGYRRIRLVGADDSMVQIFAADAGGGDGVIPTLAVIDEPHRHKSMDLYLTWSGKLSKRGAQLLLISTAGEPGSEFENLREQIRQGAGELERDGCYGRYLSPDGDVVLHEWAVPEDGDPEDLDQVKAANPLRSVTKASLRRKRNKPTMTLNHWRRFTCNQPARSDLAAISEREWFGARGDGIPAGQAIWLGFDPGWRYDPTALVPFWMPGEHDRRLGAATILEPPRDGSGLDVGAVEHAIALIHERNPIEAVVIDTLQQARDVAEWVELELGAEVIERGTSLPAQVEDYNLFMEALRQGWLTHAGDQALTRHALNAIARVLPRGDYVFGRPVASRSARHQDLRRIDALAAAATVHGLAAANVRGSVYDSRGLVVV